MNILPIFVPFIIAWMASVTVLASPALPGHRCQVLADPDWSTVEKKVWKKICIGEAVDLEHPQNGEDYLDRKLSLRFLKMALLYNPWKDAIPSTGIQITGAVFSEEVKFENVKIYHELNLKNSTFEREVSFIGSEIDGNLNIENSTLKEGIKLLRISSKGIISLPSISTLGIIIFDSKIGNNLDLTAIKIIPGFDNCKILTKILTSSEKNGSVKACEEERRDIKGLLHLDSTEINGHLTMADSKTRDVYFSSVKINRNLDMTRAQIIGTFTGVDLDISGHLLMRDFPTNHRYIFNDENTNIYIPRNSIYRLTYICTECDSRDYPPFSASRVRINNSSIGSDLNMVGAFLGMAEAKSGYNVDDHDTHVLDISNTHIGANLNLISSELKGEIRINLVTVDSNIDFTSAKLSKVTKIELTNSKVRGALTFGHENTHWPSEVNLIGTTYNDIGSVYEDYIKFLNLSKIYSPQPYQQLASVLIQKGQKDEANEVFFESKDKQWESDRGDWLRYLNKGRVGDSYNNIVMFFLLGVVICFVIAISLRNLGCHISVIISLIFTSCVIYLLFIRGGVCLWDFILRYSIGYGYKVQYALVWTVILLIFGVCTLSHSDPNELKKAKMNQIGRQFVFSFDMLVPLIELRKANYHFKLKPWYVEYYFYGHKFLGYFLAGILLGWWSGLIK